MGQGDLERVEGLARQKRQLFEQAAAAERQAHSEASAKTAETYRAGTAVARRFQARLLVLAKDLRGRVGVHVEYHEQAVPPFVVVAISSRLPPALQRPYVQLSYRPQVEHPGNVTGTDTFAVQAFPSKGHPTRLLSEGAVIAEIEAICAEFIAMTPPFRYHVPDWYPVAGSFIAWPLAVLTFALFALVGGWIGAVIGFFVAWLVKAIARPLWFPALCALGLWLIVRAGQ